MECGWEFEKLSVTIWSEQMQNRHGGIKFTHMCYLTALRKLSRVAIRYEAHATIGMLSKRE
jgi:hypothetical protein